MSKVVVGTDDERIERVARVQFYVEGGSGCPALLGGIRLRLGKFRRYFQSLADSQANLERLPRNLVDGLADQRKEIVLKPNLVKLIGHAQHQRVLIDFDRSDGRKPAVE